MRLNNTLSYWLPLGAANVFGAGGEVGGAQ